jgi:hypothetical protein
VGGSALALDGKSYPDALGDDDAFAFNGSSFSVSLWFQPKAAGGFYSVLMTQESTTSWRLYEQTSHSAWEQGIAYLLPGRNQNVLVSESSADFRWHHLIVTYDREAFYSGAPVTTRGYLDGQSLYLGEARVFQPLMLRGGKGGLRIGDFKKRSPSIQSGWRGALDDIAMCGRALGPSEARVIYLAGLRRPALVELLSPDRDGDGMSDWWEGTNGLDPNVADEDGDGLTNFEDYRLGTLPLAADTDGDGLLDGVENVLGISVDPTETGTDPRVTDSDRDGLTDGAEIFGLVMTDPNQIDSDEDGLDDAVEIRHGADPIDPNHTPALTDGIITHLPLDHQVVDVTGHYPVKIHGTEPIAFEQGAKGNGVKMNGENQSIELVDWAFPSANASFCVSLRVSACLCVSLRVSACLCVSLRVSGYAGNGRFLQSIEKYESC